MSVDVLEGGRYYDTVKNAILVRVNGEWIEEYSKNKSELDKGGYK